MISVENALETLFQLSRPMGTEVVPLEHAHKRVLAENAIAQCNQPPFPSSAMDGYAISDIDAGPGATFDVIGEAAAGHHFSGSVKLEQAVRIFTGAPLPSGAKRVITQEDVQRSANQITLGKNITKSDFIRPAGSDFSVGHKITAHCCLKPADIALLASMNVAEVTVFKKPVVALISTGDELVMPGENPERDQIIASNTFGLAALLEDNGAHPKILPIARDTLLSLKSVFDLTQGADLIVTIGGASVGDHDLVAQAATERGFKQNFYKVAMRPGKPLMAGQFDNTPLVGLPGNPVSAMVCGHVFLVPMLNAMLGLGHAARETMRAPLAHAIKANGERKHYCRAVLASDGLHIAKRQDSSLLSILANANALVIRDIYAPQAHSGDMLEYLPI
ncbi:MAG: molybdopterin molybdotransferase MoeA [Paracoccaceae bacterium]|nr:molybdopterin molybdotransferase MoeA [Paracoccaceae bacterium]